MIDLHTHLLPGIDDGPATMDEAIELARAMAGDGVTIAACTPHVRDDYTTTPEAMEAALAQLRAELATAGIPLDVRGGGEISFDTLPILDPETRARYGLAGNPKLLLLEFPYFGWPLALPALVGELVRTGTVPLLAHPERNSEVRENPRILAPLVDAGAYVQLTASAVDGSGGSSVRRCAEALLDEGLAHVLASDAHGRSVRRATLRSGSDAIGGALAAWLTEGVPRALISGTTPPPRPARERRRWPRR